MNIASDFNNLPTRGIQMHDMPILIKQSPHQQHITIHVSPDEIRQICMHTNTS